MKLTKSKLQQLIKEELGHLEEEGGPQVEWELSFEDGRVFARGMDPDTFQGDDPMEVELDPAKLIARFPSGFDELIAAIDPVELYPAIDSGELELKKDKGPPAGSMPMSQSPAYSDEEKEAIKQRRIKLGYGHEYGV